MKDEEKAKIKPETKESAKALAIEEEAASVLNERTFQGETLESILKQHERHTLLNILTEFYPIAADRSFIK